MNKVVFYFLNGTSHEVSVWSVDPTSKQESSIGWRVPPAGGRIDGEALPGTECNVRLAGAGALISTYVTTAAPQQSVTLVARGNELLLEPGFSDYWGPSAPVGKPVTDPPGKPTTAPVTPAGKPDTARWDQTRTETGSGT
jgi:hypothetical protein